MQHGLAMRQPTAVYWLTEFFRWLWLVEDYSRSRDKIGQVLPGFENFNARVAVPGGFRLANTAGERIWITDAGKTKFIAHAVPQNTLSHRARRSHANQRDTIVFTLMTTRSHEQYNTTI